MEKTAILDYSVCNMLNLKCALEKASLEEPDDVSLQILQNFTEKVTR